MKTLETVKKVFGYKYFILFLLVISLLGAVLYLRNENLKGGAQVPTEVAATSPSTASESVTQSEPTAVIPIATPQQTAQITIKYQYTNVIPQEWFGDTYVQKETIHFARQLDGTWNTVQATPVFQDHGILYSDYIFETLSNTNGACGINTYYNTKGNFTLSFQPICQTISSEEVASITFGLKNCDRDVYNNLVCFYESDKGRLDYVLSSDFNTFKFTFSGSWNYNYENMINWSLSSLGYDPISPLFFDTMIPGAGYTIRNSVP